jgi:hypothetical protein
MSQIQNNDDFFGGNDMVFTRSDDGTVIGGGYKIKSMFLEEGTPIISTFNTNDQEGGKVSSPFENLAVPAGIYYVNMRVPKKDREIIIEDNFKNHEMVPDDMMDKLYALVEVDKKRKRKTRKNNLKANKSKTRRLK